MNQKIYPDGLADRLKFKAGEKYQPPNGTEGMIFFDAFCDKCKYEGEHKPCQILGNSMIYSPEDEEYPTEWQYGSDGQPTCTAFEPEDVPTHPFQPEGS